MQNKPPKIDFSQAGKATPYFPKKVLRYEGGHIITKHKNYYVCSARQNQKCSKHTETIKQESLNKKFSRIAKKFQLNEKQMDAFPIKRIFGDFFSSLINEWINEPDNETFEASLSVGLQSLEKGNATEAKKDYKDAQAALKKILERESASIVGGIFLMGIAAFAQDKRHGTDIGRILAYLCKTVTINEHGEISSIDLSTIGDHIFHRMKALVSQFKYPEELLINVERLGISDFHILWDKSDKEKLEDVLQQQHFLRGYLVSKMIKQGLNAVSAGDIEESFGLLEDIATSPQIQAIINLNRTIKK